MTSTVCKMFVRRHPEYKEDLFKVRVCYHVSSADNKKITQNTNLSAFNTTDLITVLAKANYVHTQTLHALKDEGKRKKV
jgi:hypothetical protein